MRFPTLAEWLAWLESCHPKAIDLGLDRVARVAANLGIDLSAAAVVSIAGTNGKGSCVAALESVCLAADLRVGCYTSPHFLRYNERIRIQGEPVTDREIVQAFDQVERHLEGESLTYFEFGTLAALLLFQANHLDVVILEVGLGGRLDAVNIVDADIAILTSVGMDHMDWLGDSREAIGEEKAGIFRPGRPAICADTDPPASVMRVAGKTGTRLLLRQRDFDLVREQGGYRWWSHADTQSGDTPMIAGQTNLPLPSIAAALQAAACLGIGTGAWNSVANVSLTGRYQRVRYKGKRLLLDVAHNPDAAQWLAQRLGEEGHLADRMALFAVMADKDIEGIVQALASSFKHWHITSLPQLPRAASAEHTATIVRSQVTVPVDEYVTLEMALDSALERMQKGTELVVFGSFFTVAAVLELSRKHTPVVTGARSDYGE